MIFGEVIKILYAMNMRTMVILHFSGQILIFLTSSLSIINSPLSVLDDMQYSHSKTATTKKPNQQTNTKKS